jgi:hypothetical protein
LRASSRKKNIPTIKKIKRMITPTTTKTSFRGYPAASKVIAIPRMKIVITPAKKRALIVYHIFLFLSRYVSHLIQNSTPSGQSLPPSIYRPQVERGIYKSACTKNSPLEGCP